MFSAAYVRVRACWLFSTDTKHGWIWRFTLIGWFDYISCMYSEEKKLATSCNRSYLEYSLTWISSYIHVQVLNILSFCSIIALFQLRYDIFYRKEWLHQRPMDREDIQRTPDFEYSVLLNINFLQYSCDMLHYLACM